MTTREKETYSIHSVENALDVLEALCDETDEIQLSRLSEKLGMTKTSVFRLLATFENRGYVEREKETGRYRLGLMAFEIGQKLLQRMDLLSEARPVMDQLVRACQETVYLVVRRDTDALFLDMVDTPQQVKIVSLVGKRFPLPATAAGRVILANSPQNHWSCHATDLAAPLPADLLAIRTQGWSDGQDEPDEGIGNLAVPLFSTGGSVAGSLCFILPGFRLTSSLLQTLLLPRLTEAGQVISSKLGYLGHYLGHRLA